MIYRMYSIYDSIAREYGAPTLDHNDGTAVRNFAHLVRTSGGTLSTHRRDYALYYIGDYDTEECTLLPKTPPVLVVRGDDISND
ncbi:nonstructural protein [Sigmofec virus UA08Rod_5594]|uniref:Nonstructural protein n=1 Tax=Sigmofec virus UA08Rod_5594 TaxID=2929430 RepID=A0A976R6Y2_9VIRU|nr:nonstructural protein [Sigmofec virus UA08Rod_5594]